MKPLEEQISGRCIHFNGIMNECCKAGIKYADVRDASERPYKFPCLKQGGTCPYSQFPTADEVKKEMEEIHQHGAKLLFANVAIRQHIDKTKEMEGKVKCLCGGEFYYAVADNGHIRAKCSGCGMSFME